MGVNTKEEALQQVIEKYGDVGKTDVQKIESDSLVFFTITPVPESGNPNDSDIIYLVQQDGRIYKRTKSETNDEIHPANKEERELQAVLRSITSYIFEAFFQNLPGIFGVQDSIYKHRS
jgi:hypothetical protein